MIDQKYIELSKRRIELEDLITELKEEYKKPLAPDKDTELEIRLFQHILNNNYNEERLTKEIVERLQQKAQFAKYKVLN